MNWMTTLRSLREMRRSDIPVKLGYNAFLYSPKMKNENTDGWKIRLCNNLLTDYSDNIFKIMREMGLDVIKKSENNKHYFDIYENGHNDNTSDLFLENKLESHIVPNSS